MEAKPDRFDLEQQILSCWSITDDLKLASTVPQDMPKLINAIASLYEVKFERMFNTFETLIEDKKIL